MKDYLHAERVSLTAFRPEDADILAAFEQDSEYLRLYDAGGSDSWSANGSASMKVGRSIP